DYKNDSKNALNDWKKNESLKTQEMKKVYKWETKAKKDCNKSTLSLHIEAYENFIETKNIVNLVVK
uniref:Uncharacterized protein n=1 Tax=Panagrolaimus sp. PS1159 TaxID=55785 RepID=A0AC35GLK1_9BILA